MKKILKLKNLLFLYIINLYIFYSFFLSLHFTSLLLGFMCWLTINIFIFIIFKKHIIPVMVFLEFYSSANPAGPQHPFLAPGER